MWASAILMFRIFDYGFACVSLFCSHSALAKNDHFFNFKYKNFPFIYILSL
jgi:hypothetical protein